MAVRSNKATICTLGLALAIVAGMLLSPSRANAECGDYVIIRNSKFAAASDHSQPTRTRSDATGNREVPSKPCNGPNCSSNPFPPVSPLTLYVISTNDSKESAAPATAPSDGDDGARWSFPTANDSSPIHITRSIFHPPRMA